MIMGASQNFFRIFIKSQSSFKNIKCPILKLSFHRLLIVLGLTFYPIGFILLSEFKLVFMVPDIHEEMHGRENQIKYRGQQNEGVDLA